MKKLTNRISKGFRNAVLIKEVQIKSKRVGNSVIILIMNSILALAAIITMIATNSNIVSNYSVENSTFVIYFITVIIIEAVMLFFVTPAVSAGAIASERERQTLDVLLTTNMTPWQIVWGKYWSSIANVLLLVISTLPFLSTVFLFGGVSFFVVIGILLALIASVMYLGAFGVLMSTLIKKTNAASVICYIVLLMVTFGSISLVGTIIAIASEINFAIWHNFPQLTGNAIVNADWSLVILLFSPVTVAFDVLSKALGFSFFWYTSDGMGYFIEMITDGRLSSNCFIANLWTVLALGAQLVAAYGMLRLAAVSLNPVKNRKKKQKAIAKKEG